MCHTHTHFTSILVESFPVPTSFITRWQHYMIRKSLIGFCFVFLSYILMHQSMWHSRVVRMGSPWKFWHKKRSQILHISRMDVRIMFPRVPDYFYYKIQWKNCSGSIFKITQYGNVRIPRVSKCMSESPGMPPPSVITLTGA